MNLVKKNSQPISPMSMAHTSARAQDGSQSPRWESFENRKNHRPESVIPGKAACLGLAVFAATWSVQAFPEITVQPKDQFACAGFDVTFAVHATGTPPLGFYWYRNGTPVFDGIVSGSSNSFLTVTNVQLSDHGTWFLAYVSNHLGSAFSTNAYLFVADLPFINQHPSNQVVLLGNTINFQIHAHPSPLRYSWWFEGRQLTNDFIRVFNADTPNLEIRYAQQSDAGYYRAAISNDCRVVNSISAKCEIGGPPIITNQPVSQLAPFRASVQYSVGASGPPPLSYQWFRNDILIPGANNSSLNLSNVQRPQVGIYHVVVYNPFGAAVSDRAHLQVRLTFEGTVLPREEATDDLINLTNALFAVPATAVHHGVPLLFSTIDGTAESWETNHCSVPTTHTMWLKYYSPRNDDAVKLSSEGSDFDTVLTVYVWDNIEGHPMYFKACDNNSGYDGRSSLLFFSSEARKDYYIAVDGVGGARGIARVQVGESIRRPRYEQGKFRFEIAGPYWAMTRLRSSADIALPRHLWQTNLTIPPSSLDWLISYTNSNATGQRFYRTSVGTNAF